uniref:cytochrome c oxidase subunit II n=1 Tax=Gymnopraia lapislazula TaxID=316224 RepID=UPI0026E40E2F|nr:cytochrome c oxidase subunit II [Gymnopraia lapislazula]WJJ70113.1 cytochrome c oxidase subunit 2 [Gymnopraia lapislazula]
MYNRWNFSISLGTSNVIKLTLFFNYIHIILIFIISIVIISLFLIFFCSNNYLNFYHHSTLEFYWTLIPSVILFILAIPSLRLLYMVEECTSIYSRCKIIGNQWYWTYEVYPNISNDSYLITELNLGDFRLLETDFAFELSINKNYNLLVTSSDVIHSWSVPNLGIKIDAVPGRLNSVFLNINRVGTYYGQCSEICGSYHSYMPIKVIGK